jgi:hypothetical protein
MDARLHISQEVARRLKAARGDLSRRALKALAFEEYKVGHLTMAQLCGLLGLDTRADLDSFLKAHGVSSGAPLDEQISGHHELARAAAEGIRETSTGITLGGFRIEDLINEGGRLS